jgi:hypothetical protein
MDMGSICGVTTLSRQRDLPIVHSSPEERKFLYFSWGERVLLELSEGRHFALWPKECIVCLDKPRGSFTFEPCLHCVTCKECTDKIKEMAVRERSLPKCPICRGVIEKVEKGIDVDGRFMSKRVGLERGCRAKK